jgi:hypothetical protein
MLKLAEVKRCLLDWRPSSAGLRWLLAQGWWLVLSWPLRRSLRTALGSAASAAVAGPPTKPRRPKARLRPSFPGLSYPSAA